MPHLRKTPPPASTSGPRKPISVHAAKPRFPHLDAFVTSQGWIEVGDDSTGRSFVRLYSQGGTIWESEETYDSLDAALAAAEDALAELTEVGE